jgi:hypothetical protein
MNLVILSDCKGPLPLLAFGSARGPNAKRINGGAIIACPFTLLIWKPAHVYAYGPAGHRVDTLRGSTPTTAQRASDGVGAVLGEANVGPMPRSGLSVGSHRVLSDSV